MGTIFTRLLVCRQLLSAPVNLLRRIARRKPQILSHINISAPPMASGDKQFPPQRQEQQPGKEHAMDPSPQFAHPEYKAANKLHVCI